MYDGVGAGESSAVGDGDLRADVTGGSEWAEAGGGGAEAGAGGRGVNGPTETQQLANGELSPSSLYLSVPKPTGLGEGKDRH